MMMPSLLRSLKAIRQRNHRQKGFTLIELLIVTVIAGGIVSGLMFLVVELLAADQRDASRNATQQDMQRSMEYMSTELREAVYVYPGDQLSRLVTNNHLPLSLTRNGTPVIAFWKQAQLPQGVLDYCSANWRRQDFRGNPPIVDTARQPIPCAAGHAYSLVVYSLNAATDGPWTGQARITRYELRPYNNGSGQPNPVPGYIIPIDGPRNLFASWPLNVDGTPRRPDLPTPTGAAVPLTDFVDNEPQGNASCVNADPANPEYKISPSNGTGGNLPSYSYSFFACVRTGSPSPSPSPSPSSRTATGEIVNQEVILNLRGNGYPRPGITEEGNNAYRPTLTTRVFNRGTLNIRPR